MCRVVEVTNVDGPHSHTHNGDDLDREQNAVNHVSANNTCLIEHIVHGSKNSLL